MIHYYDDIKYTNVIIQNDASNINHNAGQLKLHRPLRCMMQEILNSITNAHNVTSTALHYMDKEGSCLKFWHSVKCCYSTVPRKSTEVIILQKITRFHGLQRIMALMYCKTWNFCVHLICTNFAICEIKQLWIHTVTENLNYHCSCPSLSYQ